MEYHDFADPTIRERFPEILERVRSQNWPLPVVSIDGEVTFQGYVSYWAIAEAIESRRGSEAGNHSDLQRD